MARSDRAVSTPNGSEARPCRICGYVVIGFIHDDSTFVHAACANPKAPTRRPVADGDIPDVDAWDAWQRGLESARQILAKAEQEKTK